MKQLLIIEGDTNDADYVTQRTEITDYIKEYIPTIRKVAKAIDEATDKARLESDWNFNNWNKSEYSDRPRPEELYKEVLTEEEIEIFNEFIPYGEGGIHDITDIRILTIQDDEILFKN